ncbi:MAG: gamma-glutamylcyclotransferase family protein [Nitrospinaceae bacterium]|nr:gamma-glutamylcyclotransferase family protein [Nitrospinaceae bacterium]
MSEKISFFAYNELMNEAYFKEVGLECIEKVTVTLSAQRIAFNRIPPEGTGVEGQGLPNIEPTPNNAGMMEGVLSEMRDTFLPKLDEFHGYPKECTRKLMDLNRHDFTIVRGIVYIAQPEKVGKNLKPTKAVMKLYKKAKKEMSMLYFSRLMNSRTCD